MKWNGKTKIVYYKNELEDDFAKQTELNDIKIDGKYKYIHKNPFWNIASFIVYRIIATPIAFFYSKIKFGIKVRNKHVLKKVNTGYFVYGNHTQEVLDPFLPTLIHFPKKAHIIAHPNNVAMKFLGTYNKMMGALPVPGNIESTKNFLAAIRKFVHKKQVIVIYPEAHVWPYCTKIRNFKSVSFKYPVELGMPVFAETTTYQKRDGKVKIVVYVDGPFYPNKTLTKKEAQEELKDAVYEAMVRRSFNSNVDVVKYEPENELKKEETENKDKKENIGE